MHNDFIIDNKVYNIATKKRIFFARFFDLVFSSIPTIILAVIFQSFIHHFKNIYIAPLILLIVGFVWLVFYFILIPWLCKTKTLGKLFFGLILYKENKNKIKLWEILIREIFIIFIPWIVGVCTNIIAFLVFKIDINNITNNSQTLLIMRITTSFYVVWYLFMIIGLFIDKKNQLFFDFHLKIYILSFIKDNNLNLNNDSKLSKSDLHIHLKYDQPGNIDDDVLKELSDMESEI